MKIPFSKPYTKTIVTKHRIIYDFPILDDNIDQETVESFGSFYIIRNDSL